jgi:hypothetical protein
VTLFALLSMDLRVAIGFYSARLLACRKCKMQSSRMDVVYYFWWHEWGKRKTRHHRCLIRRDVHRPSWACVCQSFIISLWRLLRYHGVVPKSLHATGRLLVTKHKAVPWTSAMFH